MNTPNDKQPTTIKVSELGNDFSIFGNKGNVWGNSAHIYQNGNGNLCGTPALSTNWARIDGLTECGCPQCVSIYNSMIGI